MKLYTVNGETKSISGWAKLVGISRQAMANRVRAAEQGNVATVADELVRPRDQGRRTDLQKKK